MIGSLGGVSVCAYEVVIDVGGEEGVFLRISSGYRCFDVWI